MDIRCPSCSKLFRVADEKIAGKGIRFKCSKCAEVITITRDDFEMDLLAREAEATEPVPQQTPEPATRPSPPAAPEPSIMPAQAQPILSPEPQAREYQPPPPDPDIPPASMSDFDFSEPHAAATAAANPEEGFGGHDFSFNVEPEQDAAPEVEISPEAAAEAEAAMQFPDDLISEPVRKPIFGTPAGSELTEEEDLGKGPELKPETAPQASSSLGEIPEPGPAFTPSPKANAAPEAPAAQELDLGAALAIPRGPVLTPDLQAQMKHGDPAASAAQPKAVPHADGDMDLGAALAIPKTADIAEQKGTESGSGLASRGSGASQSFRLALIIGAIAFVLVIALAALYDLGFLPGKSGQVAQQQTQPKAQPVRQEITPEGLSIVDPAAYFDPERGDLVITGKIQNGTDKSKTGWYLVTEIRDAQEKALTTVTMVNGIQIYSKTDYDILAKRGGNIEEHQKKIATLGEAMIVPKGSVSFEVRVMNPPAGSAGFLPALRAFDLATVRAAAQEGMGRK